MIQLERVSRTFQRDGREPVTALHEVSLEVRDGETLALLGPSGCGKTTMLRLMNRLLEPTGGRLRLHGVDIAGMDPVRLRRRMGYVVQSGALFPHLSVRRNVAVLCEIAGWPRHRIDARVDELLALVRLPPVDFRDRYPGELSGGQRQRVGVARALALDPEILLMDEPFAALDPITRATLQQEFLELDRLVAKTVIIVTHDLDEAVTLGDRVALLNAGRLIQVGTPDELAAVPATPWVQAFLAGRTRPS